MRDKADRILSPKVIIIITPTGIDTVRCVCGCEAEEREGKRFFNKIRGSLREIEKICRVKEEK